jgi:hypothetical protein
MDNCYLCGKEFNDSDVQKHDEHIIQQAIGGVLTANDILCSDCGGKLGENIDVPFNKIFEGISTRLDIKKDRKNNQKLSVKGKYVNLKYRFLSLVFTDKIKKLNLIDYQYQYSKFCNEIKEIEVLWQNGKVYPLKPFYRYLNNQIKIYGQKKSIKNFRRKVDKELYLKYGEEVKIIECDDLIGLVEFPFNMNDTYFKRGLAKIAIGFASKLGIKRDEMPLVLDTEKNNIKDKINSLPFYPFGTIDKFIELQKNEFEHYPFHNLILFTLNYPPEISDNKILICYIELFSTFQWYIILNDNYSGESIPYEYYAQEILKKDDYKIELGRRYYKERNIWLSPLGITEEDIDRKYLNQNKNHLLKIKWSVKSNINVFSKSSNIFLFKSRFEIEEEFIQQETIKQKYKFDFESYVNGIVDNVINQSLLSKSEKLFQMINKETDISSFLNKKYLMFEYNKIKDSLDNMQNFHQNIRLFFYQVFNEMYHEYEDVFKVNSYRIVFYDNTNNLNFYPLLKANFDELQKYQHLKFYMLEDYIQKKILRKKLQ